MAHAIFTVKAGSGYDDVPEEKYHFPAQYLARVKQTVSDLVIYYEPRRGNGRLSYIAVARVDGVDPDPVHDGHYYARMSNYLNFDFAVPFRTGDAFFESGLRGAGSTGISGDFRNAVRILPSHEFEAIITAGFVLPAGPEARLAVDGFGEGATDFKRPIIEQVVHRPFREAAFTRQVKSAYSHRCAFTGIEMRNGGGRSEVDAAHIKPVGDGHHGPDSVRNGLALSKTVHWMFDRGLISIDSDFKVLTAGSLVPEPIRGLFNQSGVVIVPEHEQDQPHPAFLRYHRNNIFKGAKV